MENQPPIIYNELYEDADLFATMTWIENWLAIKKGCINNPQKNFIHPNIVE